MLWEAMSIRMFLIWAMPTAAVAAMTAFQMRGAPSKVISSKNNFRCGQTVTQRGVQ